MNTCIGFVQLTSNGGLFLSTDIKPGGSIKEAEIYGKCQQLSKFYFLVLPYPSSLRSVLKFCTAITRTKIFSYHFSVSKNEVSFVVELPAESPVKFSLPSNNAASVLLFHMVLLFHPLKTPVVTVLSHMSAVQTGWHVNNRLLVTLIPDNNSLAGM